MTSREEDEKTFKHRDTEAQRNSSSLRFPSVSLCLRFALFFMPKGREWVLR
jgi:hypothetical protein